eukprot:1752392-Pleurochrysis_carterae.AAC.3
MHSVKATAAHATCKQASDLPLTCALTYFTRGLTMKPRSNVRAARSGLIARLAGQKVSKA